MDQWQGSKYGFLHVPDCWSHLSGSESAQSDSLINKLKESWTAWRQKYPVTVAVLDSGIKRDYKAFEHAEIQGKNFISPGTDDNIDDKKRTGHGTKCAAIIAGGCYMAEEYNCKEGVKKSDDPFEFWNGVAPFVNLYICKTKWITIVDAINHLVEEKKNNGLQVDIISCSKGNEKYNAALEKCIQEASLNNIIVVCAASNDGHKRSSTIRFPARFGHVICVGSHDYLGHASSFTPVGREIDILGPGEIKSACPVHGKPEVTNAVDEASGTSFAAPFVAGLVAIILANAQRIEPLFWSASSKLDSHHSADRADINTHETGDAAGAWVAATDDKDPWLMRDLGDVSVITGIITKGGIHDEYVTSYTISYGNENGDEKFYTDAEGKVAVFPGNKDRDTEVNNGIGPITARFIKIHPKKWRGRIAMRARIRTGGPSLRQAISNNVVMKQILREMASEPGDHTQSRGHGSLDPLRIFDFSHDFFRQIVESITPLSLPPEPGEDYKLRNYDLRKVSTNMIHSDQLLQDVEFASTIESIILRLPEQAEEGGMPRPMDNEQVEYHQDPYQNISDTPSNQPKHLELKVFRDKITADEVTKISCLSLPSPSDAAYGNKKGSAALTEFLTQLGDDLVRSVEDLWLKGTETKLTIEDIKEILQALRAPKSASTSQLTVHCEEVDVMGLINFSPKPGENLNIAKVKVIIHHYDKVCTWRSKPGQPVEMEHTDIPNTCIIIEACSPECPSRQGWEEQVVSEDGSIINLKFPVKTRSDKRRKELLSKAMETVKTKVTEPGKTVSCLILPCVSDAVLEDKEGVEALKAVLDKTAQVNNLKHLWCGGTEDKPLEWQHLTEILRYLQQKRKAAQSLLTMHFYQIKELKGDLSHISSKMQNLNTNVIIHHSAAVCTWRQAQGFRVGKEHTTGTGGIVTVEACPPGCTCNSTRKEVVSAEDMACDIISCDNPTSRDGAAALHATIQKHVGNLKKDIHVTVAVLGSGIYIDHKDVNVTQIIKDKNSRKCFVPQESLDLSVDTHGTGTALASIATSFAPAQTRLLTAKVMNEQGRSNPAWVARAVDWAANHDTYPADVILIPVGFEKFDHRVYKAVTEAQKNGKIVIAAAARNTEAREISYPARHGDVICVGSHSSFDVKGREMDFLMMGEQHPVKAASAKGTDSYTSVCGTSVAAAMATAVVGFTLLYAESVGGNNLRDQLKSNTMIRELLREACSSLGFHKPDRGYGTLDPDRLFKWGPQHFKELVKKITGT